MVEFIIDESNNDYYNLYEMIIFSCFGYTENEFKISRYDSFKNSKVSNKIYILANKSRALKIAKEIRTNKDWNSLIIIIGIKFPTHNRLLIFDFIAKNDDLKENIKNAIYEACKIFSLKKTLNFITNNQVHKIPYDDILYIEKSNNLNSSLLYTKDNVYTINNTIKGLEEKLDKICFMKTHRSCIINLNNVRKYDCTSNIVYFDNAKIDLVCRDKRQLLKNILTDEKIKE